MKAEELPLDLSWQESEPIDLSYEEILTLLYATGRVTASDQSIISKLEALSRKLRSELIARRLSAYLNERTCKKDTD